MAEIIASFNRYDFDNQVIFSEGFFHSLVNIIDDSIIILDKFSRVIYYNETSEKIFKYKSIEVIGKNIEFLIPTDFQDEPGKDLLNGEDVTKEKFVENIANSKDGKKVNIELSVKKYSEGNDLFYILLVRDISKRKLAEEKLKYLSFHDKLTGLYNRSFFEEELRRLNTTRQLPLSIIIGDIDGFKLVNDAFGYKKGDRLLKSFARLLKDSCRSEDVLARWGGDEFVILLPKTDRESVLEIISRIQKKTKLVTQNEIPLNISLGFAIKSGTEDIIDKVIKKAEDLMKQNKLLQSKKVSNEIISSIKRRLNERSENLDIISERIRNMALNFGRELKLTKEQIDRLGLFAEFYDVGKVAIKKNILKKRTKLEEAEWQIVKMHPEIGYRIAKSSTNLAHIADDILAHHESWDGNGYPYGVRGANIPLNSRIISIIESYDVMINGRNYKDPVGKDGAISELKKLAKKQFDPQLVTKFIEMIYQQENHLSLFQ
jgi:diguanylate cyclase (GGDEF)-like protein/PAS domain S-box-containing protein